MAVFLSDDTKAILLLCGIFGDRSVKPLSPREYNSVARWLAGEGSRPQHLLSPEVAERASREAGIAPARLDALLARGVALGFAVEQWERNGIWIVSRGDADYPVRLKKHIKEKSPPLLFGVGDRALLQGGGLAVVGSRNVDSEGGRFTLRTRLNKGYVRSPSYEPNQKSVACYNRAKPPADEEVIVMSTDVKERKRLYRLVRHLPREDVEKVTSYAAFLRSIQDKEDQEDLRIIEERADEPTIPWEEVKRELGL